MVNRTRDFAATVERWVTDNEKILRSVARQSIDDAVHIAQLPKEKGGNMPVDTGFLRSSGIASLNGWASGPSEKPDGATKDSIKWTNESVITTLVNLQPGDTFYFGWTAVYALRQETYNGFMETTAQKWQSIVNANIGKLKNG